jgi:uncharacterized membrane protein YccF (DUF307 family)
VPAEEVGERRVLGTAPANLLWFLCAGLWLAISHVTLGAALCATVIGIPFGWAHFKLALVSLAPLGKRIVCHDDVAIVVRW